MIGLRTRRPVLFGAMLVIALVALFPLRLGLGLSGLGDEGLSAREVMGPAWWGGLSEAHYGDVPLGDLNAGLSPIQLFIGRARFDVAGREGSPNATLSGALSFSRSTSGVDDVTATIPAGDAFAPVPVTSIALDDVSVRFRDGACERAEGKVTATIAATMPQLNLPPQLSGIVRCDGGALLIPLATQAQTESIAVTIQADGRYRATLTARPSDLDAAATLTAAGFRAVGDGYRLTVVGNF
ncbi:type II secretion system protein N [Sphingomonas sp.]|jgi:general secretion pathway protein N|uniref:type II secretion system protein N n=1 Tax=Sphingomonas sp. TaxID=28214 RepID=UPI002E342CC4|nr:type II secretion system protein N [Sphingomonas sp.]HEX4693963.1 type II secretion system protein N [Sphingomonas sp.]